MNISEPQNNNKILIPELIFVPCLAFDHKGNRLGYGGGYYDRTFAYLNKINHRFISVAYAYEGQKLDYIPIDKFDFKVDYVITEKIYIVSMKILFIGDIVGKASRKKLKKLSQHSNLNIIQT